MAIFSLKNPSLEEFSDYYKKFQIMGLKPQKKILHLHAHKNGKLDIIYANYCTISTKRKSQYYQEE